MRVLFSSTSGWGHIHPMLPLAISMRDRGNDVVFATAEDARPRVEDVGLDWVGAGTPSAVRMASLAARYPEAATMPRHELPTFMFPRLFGEIAAAPMFDDLLPFATEWKPEAIVHDAADFAAPIIGAALGVPHVTHSFGTVVPAANVAAAAQRTEPLWRRLELEPRPFGGCYDHLYLDIFPPSMLPPDDRSHLGRITSLRSFSSVTCADQAVSASVAAALSSGRPLVYVTFGTVFNAPDALGATLAALGRRTDLAAVVTVGPNAATDALDTTPEHVAVERYVPQDLLLPHCAAVVSHGGSGTMLGSLAHGVPLLILPQAADQFRNAEACARAGVGLVLVGTDATADHIDAALSRILEDADLRQNAERIQAEIGTMPSPDEVAALVEGLPATS